jgi:hypothetical protein
MNSHLYLSILALHLAALALFGGMVLITDLRLLGLAMSTDRVEDLIGGLRVPKRVGCALAVASGALLFGAETEWYLHNPWFWTKMALLLLLGANYFLFRRGPWTPGRAKLTGGLSLLLWAGVICAGRGPATIKDVMHSMIDPTGDFVFESVKEIGDEHGSRQQAPETDADWQELRRRLAVLQEVPDLLDGRGAARPRDRSRNPQSENEPGEIQKAIDADHAALLRRARKLQDAAAQAIKAADARDTKALLPSIDLIDKACENCHLHYWYPNDKRAQQAAKEDGVTDF